MEYSVGTRITFTINKKPPYVHVSLKPRVNREYEVGASVILNQIIKQASDVFVVKVKVA